MKTVYVTTMMITAIFMLILPLASKNTVGSVSASVGVSDVLQGDKDADNLSDVKVKITATGKVETFSAQDYIFGVVAAEMPALFEEEALKAQTVAAYTYFLIKKEGNSSADYDITDDYTVDQAFITPASARDKWGSNADGYENKIRTAVNLVLGKTITYNGQLANSVYHAISFGVTENASEVWGGDYPYLSSVDSSWDKLNDDYISTVEFTAEEMKNALGIQISDSENCIGDIVRTKAGGVKSLTVSGTKMTGSEIRNALNLRSSDFDVEFSKGKYIFTTRGYGHAIGMSQHGANYMAMQGKTYEEILLHYYSGCKIE